MNWNDMVNRIESNYKKILRKVSLVEYMISPNILIIKCQLNNKTAS